MYIVLPPLDAGIWHWQVRINGSQHPVAFGFPVLSVFLATIGNEVAGCVKFVGRF